MTQVDRPSRTTAIDRRVLDEHTAADPVLKREVLALFIGQGQALHALLTRATGRDELLSALHRLKGAARAVGADPLALCLERCERGLEDARGMSRQAVAALQNALADACRSAADLVTDLEALSSPNDWKAGKHPQPSVSHSGKPGAREAED